MPIDKILVSGSRRVTPSVCAFVLFACVVLAVPCVLAEDTQSTPAVKPEFKIDALQMRAKYNNRVIGMVQSSTMPSGFPAPVYTSGQVSTNFVSTTNSKNPIMAATIMTYDPAGIAAAWYKQQISTNGWTPKAVPLTQQRAGEMYCMAASKGNTNVTVTCVKPKKGPYTIINVSTITSSPAAPLTFPTRDVGLLRKQQEKSAPAPSTKTPPSTTPSAKAKPTTK